MLNVDLALFFKVFVCVLQGNLEQIQGVLNTTEIGLHQLTALVDCRSLHMVSCLPAWDTRGTMANIRTPQGMSYVLCVAWSRSTCVRIPLWDVVVSMYGTFGTCPVR